MHQASAAIGAAAPGVVLDERARTTTTTPTDFDVALQEALAEEQAALAAAEAERLAFAEAASRGVPRAVFSRPAHGAMTGWWGERRRRHMHSGIDYDGETGDPVFAAGRGTVVHAGWAPADYSGYGLMVLIDHGGVQTLYAHLSRLGVSTGQVVGPGDRIGLMGTTGNVTGSHLHFEVRVNGQPVNPNAWLLSHR